MDRSLYISSVGLANIERAQTARANNLANVSTTGFRADLARFGTEEVTSADTYRVRSYGVNQGAGVDLSSGVQLETGRNLDVAVNGDGFFAVVDETGTEGYTRSGSLQIDATGRLLNGVGRQLMGLAGPIALPPFENVLIGADGTISVRPQGQGPDALAVVDQLKLVNPEPDQVYKGSNGLLYNREEIPFIPDANVTVNSGFLESSNVNAIHELTEILSLARQFELEVRMMQTAESNDEAAAQLLRVN